MIQIDKLLLQNYRCFEECEITFRPDLTVLVARNGQGKTAILDAIALSLEIFVNTLSGISSGRGFDRRDFRRSRDSATNVSNERHNHVRFEAFGLIDGNGISWDRRLRANSKYARNSTKGITGLRSEADSLRGKVLAKKVDHPTQTDLPLVAYYGTGRQWRRSRFTARRWRYPQVERFDGYIDSLNSGAGYGLFVDWYETAFRSIRNSIATGYRSSSRPEMLLAAVNDSVKNVLFQETGWHDLGWDMERNELTLKHDNHGRLPVNRLSDGVRTTLALVADVAHRCARLNPHYGENAAENTPGILLIDEVDLHLHPEWQQTILGMLRDAFPKVQMIVTTHSPQVLSAVNVNSIRDVQLHNGYTVIKEPQFQTKGVESADVLAVIMDVDPVADVPEAKLLRKYRVAIDEGRAKEPEILDIRNQLIGHFGKHHPVILDCDRLIRFMQFKNKRVEGETAGHA